MKKKSQSAITRLPVDDDPNPTVSKDIDQFINKGLKTSEPASPSTTDEQEPISRIQLRLPKSKVEQIDLIIKERDVKVSRHVWFLEAIEEKLKREQE